ncbi:glycosyltransferase family 2 protein [bacterium]|jgi:glycosyltransferase involved in cell wall biosynthesis|nr:glycosyltransferase family 2 protein [bacterium]
MKHKISFIVPTMDREKDLYRMLKSLEAQSVLPDQVIIVDGSYNKVNHMIDKFPLLKIEYVRVFPPSLSKQKNAGVKKVSNDSTLVGYLDDDLEFYKDSVENMLSFWDKASDKYGGAAFSVTNIDRKVGSIRKFFKIDSDSPGKVFSNGFVSMLDNPGRTTDVDWLYGGATVWKREVIGKYEYDEWYQGSGFMEDIDFSYNIREKYNLIVLAEARVQHHTHPIRGDRYYLLGKWQIINRLYFVGKYIDRGLSVSDAWKASFSVILVNLLAGIARLNYNRIRMAAGNIVGLIIALIKKDAQIVGHLKRINKKK